MSAARFYRAAQALTQRSNSHLTITAATLTGAAAIYGLTQNPIYAQGYSSKRGVYDVEVPGPELDQPRETRFQAAVNDIRVRATRAAKEAGETSRNIINAILRAEGKVEAVVRKVHDRQEQLMPNLLYVGLAGLAGSIVTRQRSILARIFWPPVFALATSLYVLPNTTRSALRLLRDTIDSPEFRKPIQEHAPVILDTTDATRSAVAQGATQATKLRYQLEESLSQQVARVRHEYNSLEGKVRNALSSGAASVSEQVQELTDKSSQAYRKATSEIRAHTKEITGWLGRAVPAGNHEKRLTSSEKVERTQEDISRLASHINARLHEEAKEAREKAEILARQVKREAQEAHEKANALARKVAEDVAHATEVAEKRAEKAEKSIRETIKQAPHAIKEAVEDAEERVEELLDRGREKLDQVKASVKRSLRSEDDRRPT